MASLTDTQKLLIAAAARNDMLAVRKWAKQCLLEDTTKQNADFCNSMIEKFVDPKVFQLPQEIAPYVYAHSPEEFDTSKYFCSESEAALLKQISDLRDTASILKDIGLNYFNTTLLHGPTGCGKTMFCKYVAHELGLPYVYIKLSQTIDPNLGGTGRHIGAVMDYAMSNPCVLIIDEIDTLSENRMGNISNDASREMQRVTAVFLQQFDRLTPETVVLAATNCFEKLDDALVRRFNQVHEMKQLTAYDRDSLIRRILMSISSKLDISIPIETRTKISVESRNNAELVNKLILEVVKYIQQHSQEVKHDN